MKKLFVCGKCVRALSVLQVCALALLLVLLSMAACGGKTEEQTIESDPGAWSKAETTEGVQIPNPWIDCTKIGRASCRERV